MFRTQRCLLLSLLLLALFLPDIPSVNAQRTQNVAVTQVQELEFAGSQNSVGIINASKTARVGAAVDGRVADLLVEEGDAVTTGQPLAAAAPARVDGADLQAPEARGLAADDGLRHARRDAIKKAGHPRRR